MIFKLNKIMNYMYMKTYGFTIELNCYLNYRIYYIQMNLKNKLIILYEKQHSLKQM